MKKIVLFMLTLAILSSMFILPSFAATPGNIEIVNGNVKSWGTTTLAKGASISTAPSQTAFNITTGQFAQDGSIDDFLYDGNTTLINGAVWGDEYKPFGKKLLGSFIIDKSADVYIGVYCGYLSAGHPVTYTPDWLEEEGYMPAYNAKDQRLMMYNGNGQGYYLYKKTFIASQTAKATIKFYSVGSELGSANVCPILVDWINNPEVNSSYVFKGKSGEDGDDNVYTYVFSKITNATNGADYGVEAGGKWYSLIKDAQDKTEYNKAISSGYYAIGLADPDAILGSSYTVTPQIRFEHNIVSSAAEVTIDSNMPENGSDSSLKSVSLSTTENGSNAVLLNDIEPGVFEYDFMYEDESCFNHTIIAEPNDLGSKVEVTDATAANPIATVKVTSENGNTSTYTFNYTSISTYTKQAATGTVYTAYNNAMKTQLKSAVVNSGYGYVYNGSTQKSVAVLKFPISALENATEGIYLSMRNIEDGTNASLTFNIYSLTGSTTSTDYDEVIAMKDKLLGSATVKGSKPGSYIVKLDKDIIQAAIDDDNSTTDTITIIVENALQLSDYKSNMIFCTYNNNTYPLRLLYK